MTVVTIFYFLLLFSGIGDEDVTKLSEYLISNSSLQILNITRKFNQKFGYFLFIIYR
jgi:hypothetical protein